MEQREFGRTGQRFSVLGYGAGAVGGLFVRGSAAEQEQALGTARDAGITYVDTAPAYGDGASERHLGAALKALGWSPILGTKVRLPPAARGDIAGAIAASLDASLSRLGRDSIDLLQLHDAIGGAEGYTVAQVLEAALPALERARAAGKCRWIGLTALGETAALRQVLAGGAFDAAQIPFNLLNPSWLAPRPTGLPGQDFEQLGVHSGLGLLGIRILAAGALSGEAARHPIAMPQVAPIASAADYATDLAHARRLLPLVEAGVAANLAELATRYAVFAPGMSCALIGTASLGQLEAALAAVSKGPLPAAALARIAELLA
jgi:L-galactose dehydrogenase/L-glyceraldehyde 3-phosphate reductase